MNLFSQTDTCKFKIKGIILDVETKDPVPFVSVVVRDANRGTIANLNGEFVIDGLCSQINTLIISCHGYCDSICQHNHQHGKVPHIYLTQKVVNVGTVTINAQVNKKKGTESISQITVDKSELKSDPTRSLASAIEDEQGVSLTSVGVNVQIPIIHGLYGNRILILNNGLKHGFQNWGQDHAPEIDITSANKVTIIKGAAGVRFGPEALGGAIVVESNPLYLREPFYAEVRTGFQTNGRGYNSGFEVGQGRNNFSYFINGNHTKIGDRATPQYMLTNSGKEEQSLGSGIRYRNEKLDVKAYYSLVDQNLGLLRASFFHSANAIRRAFESDRPDSAYTLPFSYTINEPNQLTQHHLVKGEAKWIYSEHGNLVIRAGKQLNKRREFDVRRNSHKPIIDLDLTTNDIQLEWNHPDKFQLDGMIGVQYFYQDNDNNPGTGTTPFIPNYNTGRYSAFIVESKRIGEHIIEAGARLDYESSNVRGREVNQAIFRDEYSFMNITSSIGYIKNINKSNYFRTSIGTAWRSPNMAELFSFGQHGFKNSYGLLRYYFNEQNKLKTDELTKLNESAVKPEKGLKLINELKVNSKFHSHNIVVYTNYISDFIYLRPFGLFGSFRGPQPTFIFDQTNAVFLGADYDWVSEWSNQFKGTFGFSYLWSRNITDKETLINQPPVTISYKLEWEQKKFWKFSSSRLIIRPFYRLQQFQAPRTLTPNQLIEGEETITSESEIFDFKSAPEGYFMLRISWEYEWNNFKGSVGINNALNTNYRDYLNEMRYFADAPGRNILFSLNYKFNNQIN